MFQDMVEADVYYGAINDNSKTRLYQPELLAGCPEILAGLCPDGGRCAGSEVCRFKGTQN